MIWSKSNFVQFNQLYMKRYQHSHYEINVIRCIMELIFITYNFCLVDVDFFSMKLVKLYKVWLWPNLICRLERNGGSNKETSANWQPPLCAKNCNGAKTIKWYTYCHVWFAWVFYQFNRLIWYVLYIILLFRFVNWLSDVHLITEDNYVLVVAS